MKSFESILLLFTLAFMWFWDYPEATTPIIGPLRAKVRPYIEALGLGHSWKLFAKSDYPHAFDVEVRILQKDGSTNVWRPGGVSETLWCWNIRNDQLMLKTMLGYFLARNPGSSKAEIVLLTHPYTPSPKRLFDRWPLIHPNEPWSERVLATAYA
jgi:hypothetical protein